MICNANARKVFSFLKSAPAVAKAYLQNFLQICEWVTYTTSTGVSRRRSKFSHANGQRLGRQDSRERDVVARHGARVRHRLRRSRRLARRHPNKKKLHFPHSSG